MPQITITVDVDDDIGDIAITIEEVQAHGITIRHGQDQE